MSHNKPDVYIAVKKDNAEKVEALFLQHQIDFDEDDMCSPFGSDGSLYVFYFPSVKNANAEVQTALLLEHCVPFSLSHGAGSDFHYGWSHGRLNEDGSMSYTEYFGEGETLNISDIQNILNNSETLADAKEAVAKMIIGQTYPDW